jgi:GT2 family glycosyltransferase
MQQHDVGLSIIIVNWNVKEYLKGCLESIYNLTQGVVFEVCVVDNGSSDGSVDMVKNLFPCVHLIENQENKGFAQSNNMALTQASGRYIMFLNPDTRLVGNALKASVDFLDTHTDAAGIGTCLLNADGSIQTSCRHFPSLFTDFLENTALDWLFPRSPIFNYYRMGGWAHDQMRVVDVPFGASLVIRRSLLSEIGLMDERFFMYYDEIDLCYRIKKKRGRIYFTPDIKIIHYGNKSSNQVKDDVLALWKYRSKLQYFNKHYGRFGILGLMFNLTLQSIVAWGPLTVTAVFFKYPRGLPTIKERLRLNWKAYLDFLQICPQ